MILQTLINLGYSLLSAILGLFPLSTGFPSTVLTSAQTIGGYAGIFSPLVDWASMTAVLTLVFGVEIAIFGFKTLMRFISHIPFIGGRG